jgi:hypothetical protein
MIWLRVVAMCCVLVMAGPPAAWSQDTEGWDRYLDRPRGPYRGQVVDAETKVPLAGAVVVVHWRRDRVYPFHSVSENYAVRETVTDAEGRFFLDAKDVEEGAPRRTYHPEFLIFLPGYGSYPRHQVSPRGFTGNIRTAALVELPKLEGKNMEHLTCSARLFDSLQGSSRARAQNQPERSVGLNPCARERDHRCY